MIPATGLTFNCEWDIVRPDGMKYLLDTCTVSDFVKGQANVLARV